MDLETYRGSESEQLRLADLLNLLPRGQATVLEIGARDGYHSRVLRSYFGSVIALDLQRPRFSIAGVINVQGDVTSLPFRDRTFDCVLCAEVLEHVPALRRAATEITRVTRHHALIGVPYRQDTRVGKLTCSRCWKVSPPYGHLNTFDEHSLQTLFGDMHFTKASFVGSNLERTNAISSFLMTLAGNPWGTYDQEEPCIHCGAQLRAPQARSFAQRVASRLASQLDRTQRFLATPSAGWIHVLFSKNP
jgi:SAM-dependent methyltransferase